MDEKEIKEILDEKEIKEIAKEPEEDIKDYIEEKVNDDINMYDRKLKELKIKLNEKTKDKIKDLLILIDSLMFSLESSRKAYFKTDDQRKQKSDIIDAMFGFDFYPTPEKYGELIYDLVGCDFESDCHILEPACGLLSLSMPFILNGIDITLNELNSTFLKYIEPVKKLPNVNLIEGDFIRRNFENNDFNNIIMNPPFSGYIKGKENKLFYLYFLYKAHQVLNNSSATGERLIYMICPKTYFYSLKSSNKSNIALKQDDEGELCYFYPPQSVLKESNKIFNLDLEEYEGRFENGFPQVRYICDVSGFKTFAKNGRPIEMKQSFGLFQFIHSVNYSSEDYYKRREREKIREKKIKEFLKGEGRYKKEKMKVIYI